MLQLDYCTKPPPANGHLLGQVIHNPGRTHTAYLLPRVRRANGQYPRTASNTRLDAAGSIFKHDTVLNLLAQLFRSGQIPITARLARPWVSYRRKTLRFGVGLAHRDVVCSDHFRWQWALSDLQRGLSVVDSS